MTRRQRVLAIDDEPDIRRLIKAALSNTYDVVVAADGEDGLRMALASPPDIILTDLEMPGMTGKVLLRHLREEPSLEDVSVVVLTGQEEAHVRLDLLQAGAQDLLVKPFSVEELRVRIGNLIRVKLARELLQDELQSRERDVGTLVLEAAERRTALQAALEATKEARDHAENANRAKTRFLMLLSHELRTPLTVLLLTVDGWLRQARSSGRATDPEGRRMKAALDRLRATVDGVIAYASIQPGRQKHLESVDLVALIGELRLKFEEPVASKGLRLEIEVADKAKMVTIDPHIVKEILSNLISNAIRYSESGSLQVQASVAGGLVLVVRDNGRGINATEYERIFQPFEHVEPIENKSTPGIGLGLTLVRELANSVGGQVTVQSEESVGSTFTVTIPIS